MVGVMVNTFNRSIVHYCTHYSGINTPEDSRARVDDLDVLCRYAAEKARCMPIGSSPWKQSHPEESIRGSDYFLWIRFFLLLRPYPVLYPTLDSSRLDQKSSAVWLTPGLTRERTTVLFLINWWKSECFLTGIITVSTKEGNCFWPSLGQSVKGLSTCCGSARDRI